MAGHGVHRRRPSWWLGFAVLGLCALAAGSASDPACAQIATPSLEFSIPKTVFAKEGAEAPFVIELKVGDKLPQDSWLEIVTVPPSITLSAGTMENGIWRVPLSEVRGLALKVPADVFGEGFIYVTLMDNGTLMTAATSTLSIAQRPTPPPVVAQAPPPPPRPAKPVATAAAASTAKVETEGKAATAVRAVPSVVGSIDAPSTPQMTHAPSAAASPPSTPAVEPSAIPVVVAPAPPAAPPAQTAPPAAVATATAVPAAPQVSAQPASTPAAPAAAPAVAVAAPDAPASPQPQTPAVKTATPPVKAPPPATVAIVAPAAPAPPIVVKPASAPVAPATAPAAAATAPNASPPPQPQPAAARSDPPRSAMTSSTPRQQRLIAQGESNLSDGNIAVARQYFSAAAELGSAVGAFKLAETNDPYELEKAKIVGLKIDPAEAKRWYQRAAELGMGEAAARLERLQAR